MRRKACAQPQELFDCGLTACVSRKRLSSRTFLRARCGEPGRRTTATFRRPLKRHHVCGTCVGPVLPSVLSLSLSLSFSLSLSLSCFRVIAAKVYMWDLVNVWWPVTEERFRRAAYARHIHFGFRLFLQARQGCAPARIFARRMLAGSLNICWLV